MGTVNIPSPAGTAYLVYGDLPSAKAYLAASVGPGPDAWNALVAAGAGSDTQLSMLVVSAYRYLERQSWNPTTAPDAATRSGILAFQQAEYELAALALANPTILGTTDQGSNVMILSAGPVKVEYFRPTSAAAGTATKLPQVVMDLIGSYLYAVATGLGATAYSSNCNSGQAFDDCIDSTFTDQNEFTRGDPF